MSDITRGINAVKAHALREMADEVERHSRIGLTPQRDVNEDDLAFYKTSPLWNVRHDGTDKTLPSLAFWLRWKADRIEAQP